MDKKVFIIRLLLIAIIMLLLVPPAAYLDSIWLKKATFGRYLAYCLWEWFLMLLGGVLIGYFLYGLEVDKGVECE